MIRALLRLMSMVALSVAVIAAVIDATRSIAAEALVVTPLRESWADLWPTTLGAFEAFILDKLPDSVWTVVFGPVLQLPTFAVFAGLALLLYVACRRRAPRTGKFVLDH